MIGEVFEDFILRVLCVAAVVSTTLGVVQDGWAHGFQEGAGIVIAIVIIVMVTVINDYIKEKQFQELMSKSDVLAAKVRRGDTWKTLDSEQIVVGDVVEIAAGETIPADCLVLAAHDCSCSEAALTGEPDGLPKEPATSDNLASGPDPFLLQASLCEKGTAKALVVAVGNNTNQGRAGLSMNIEAESTPLQKKLDRIAEGIGKLGVAVAILTFIAIVISALVAVFKDEDRDFDMDFVRDVCNGLVIAITVVVVAVPEGLPLAVTISLAYSVGKMQGENNLVRKLGSSETMGNANEICTDKTGTLTQNRMSVQSAYLESQIRDGDSTELSALSAGNMVEECVIYNSTAFQQTKEDGTEEITGNVTEVGLIKYLAASGADVKAAIGRREALEMPFAIPFSSTRKRATTAYKIGDKYRVFVKGAPEVVIKRCDRYLAAGGDVRELTEAEK
jgi:calcium-translocating P-type ATPase